MIKINVFNESDYDKSLLQRAVDAYHAERVQKSFAERHPELGRMINCAVCNLRHRSSRTCIPIYSRTLGTINEKGELIPDTKRQANGAAAYKGSILKHRNAWGLQVLERATLIFRDRDDHRDMWWLLDDVSAEALAAMKKSRAEYEDKLGKQSLSRALNEKRRERALRRKKLLTIAKRSRRINRG